MVSNSLNKIHFHFVCTNYGSNKDGIGHYTSKVVCELKKNNLYKVSIYTSKTHHISKLKSFFSFRMSKETLSI